MELQLDEVQRALERRVATLADEQLAPVAEAIDREQRMPPEVIASMAEAGLLGLAIAPRWGGTGVDKVSLGLAHQQVGRACSSLRSLLTVHSMASQAIGRWAHPSVQERWLPQLARGQAVGAFALTEPLVGSDAASIELRAERTAGGFRLSGEKCWITCGQNADVFVVFARTDKGPSAFVVEADAPGLQREPIAGALGTRGSMLARLRFDDCAVPAEQQLSREGSGVRFVAAMALALGRYSVAWGALGILQAALIQSTRYAAARVQYGSPIVQHQLIRRRISDMLCDYHAARLLCWRAGRCGDSGDAHWLHETFVAKYVATTAAMRAADSAVQIHGANGCDPAHGIERLFRDAKVLEIIEGSSEIQQITIADYALQLYGTS